MSLALYFHPLASFCWKVLIALYENDTPFAPHVVDLMDERQRTEFLKISPFGKFPVLHDDEGGQTVLESTTWLGASRAGRRCSPPTRTGR
jgi:glutathione S-transferase